MSDTTTQAIADALLILSLGNGNAIGKDAAERLMKLERENAALRADKERLDWLQTATYWPYPTLGKNVRAAIDAAMQEEKAMSSFIDPSIDSRLVFNKPVEGSFITIPISNGYSGMTLRDWFAGQALAQDASAADYDHDWCVKRAYMLADAMLAERVKGITKP